jgi:hypothetical protein
LLFVRKNDFIIASMLGASHGLDASGDFSNQPKLLRSFEEWNMERKDEGTRSCSFEGREYVHAEKMCLSSKCVECRDGEWVETEDIFVL